MPGIGRQVELHAGELAAEGDDEEHGDAGPDRQSGGKDDQYAWDSLQPFVLQEGHGRVQHVGQDKGDEELQEDGG